MHGFVCLLRSSLWYVVGLCALFLTAGLYLALHSSPADYRQGEVVRIMYLHVPSAWISLVAYSTVAALSLFSLVKKDSVLPQMLSRSMAPVGACFTAVCLVAGSVWGRHTWGTWWVWDARLTSVLLLFFLYLGYTSLWNVYGDQHRAARASSLFAVFSAINVPIVKFSVDIWSTLHQTSSIMRKSGIAIDISMLIPLITMFIGLSLLFVVFTVIRINTLLIRQQIKKQQTSYYDVKR